MQSGIGYTPGQLLAVVAPGTALVVDAPTDWSLAGPLWELALDEAPLDEILDVLVRRGIRVAPAFAIVRVEGDAVRALVRGNVPVAFERSGDPVRLDATGATTWLEGLVSGARQAIVGDPTGVSASRFRVATGVVLVSGLAMPCTPGPFGDDDGGATVDGSTATAAPVPDPSGGSIFDPPARTPVARVVDLTRVESRPAPAVAAPAAPAALTPAALTPAALAPAPAAVPSGSELTESPVGPAAVEPGPVDAGPVEPSDAGPADSRTVDAGPVDAGPVDVGPVDAGSVDAGSVDAGSVDAAPVDAESVAAAPQVAVGHDDARAAALPGPATPPAVEESVAVEASATPEVHPTTAEPTVHDESLAGRGASGAAAVGAAAAGTDSDTSVEDRPRGPLPTDLPNLDAPSLSLPLPVLPPAAQPVADLGDPFASADDARRNPFLRDEPPMPPRSPLRPAPDVPSAWPPAEVLVPGATPGAFDPPAPETPAAPAADPVEAPAASAVPAEDGAERRDDSGEVEYAASSVRAADLAPVAPAGGGAREVTGSGLPFRVRGQSLRPEQRQPLNGTPVLAGPPPVPAVAPPPPAPGGTGTGGSNGSSGSNGSAGVVAKSTGKGGGNGAAREGSGSLLLPAFFRGARAARSKAGQPPAPRPDEPGTPGGGLGEPPSTPDAVGGAPEAPREPPRLLGVWCDAGHVTPPDRPTCRVCALAVPPQSPILVARPPLGVLVFDDGDRVVVDRPVVLGRDPKPVLSQDPEPPVLHTVVSATGQVSRTHAEVRADGWNVVITDLDAMNGTVVTEPGGEPVVVEPGVPVVIAPGTRVDLGGEVGFVLEVDD